MRLSNSQNPVGIRYKGSPDDLFKIVR
jgi:hypothetical protein